LTLFQPLSDRFFIFKINRQDYNITSSTKIINGLELSKKLGDVPSQIVIADTSNINSNYFASLRIAVEKSQISLKSITSNNIIQHLIINSNIFITSNIGIGKTNPIYNIDVISNINADNYFIPKAIEFINQSLFDAVKMPDVIIFDMVHSHSHSNRGRKQPSYTYFKVDYKRCAIDISAAVVRCDLANAVGFRDKSHDGDATYFEDVKKEKVAGQKPKPVFKPTMKITPKIKD
jgi:hypothetical protein